MTRLTELYRYPIKSSMPISLQESVIKKRGLEFDRLWAVFDKSGQALTGREYPNLLDIEAKVSGDELLICYRNETVGRISLALSDRESKHVKVFSYETQAVLTDSSVDAWFSDFLVVECQLLFQQEQFKRPVLAKHGGADGETVGFADQCPILLTTEASLADLNNKLNAPILMNRFRPNVVVNGTDEWDEDEWKRIRIGECEFKVNQACIRCVFTTIDPISKAKDPGAEPLRTMNSFRKGPQGGVVFGMHLTPITLGTIKLKDKVTVIE